MRQKFKSTLVTILWIVFSLFLVLQKQGSGQVESLDADKVRAAPPAPVFNDQARLAELAQRRRRVAEKVGPRGMLALFAAEPRVYTGDVDYPYRQENNFFYLTGLTQDDARLVLMPGNAAIPEVLFLPRRRPEREIWSWSGRMYSPEDAARISGIREIWEAGEFEHFARALTLKQSYYPRPKNVLLSQLVDSPPLSPATSTPSQSGSEAALQGYENLLKGTTKDPAPAFLLVPRFGESKEYEREQRFSENWGKTATGFKVESAWPIFTELRLVKSSSELLLMQHAIDISTEAIARAMLVSHNFEWEYQVAAGIEYIFKLRGAEHWGYPSIVGSGADATLLHYEKAAGLVGKRDLMLIDAGAEYDNYSADVTRTFPVDGKFSPEQAAIYGIVFSAQEAGLHAIHAGGTLGEVHSAAVAAIKEGLLRIGLITDRSSNQFFTWFMTGTSHFLGMNVHDLGNTGSPLKPGMVFTVEPGIYVRSDALEDLPKTPENLKFIASVRPAFEKYKNIGVRIEDDVVITEKGYRMMTSALPRDVSGIEKLMAR